MLIIYVNINYIGRNTVTQSSCIFIILFLHFNHFNLTSPNCSFSFPLSPPLLLTLYFFLFLFLFSFIFLSPHFASRTRKWFASFGFNHRDALPGHPVHPFLILRFPRCMAGGREIASTKPQEPAVMCKSTTTATRGDDDERAHASSLRRHGVYTHTHTHTRLPSSSLS